MRVSASQDSEYHCPSFLYSRIFAKLKDPSQPLLIVSDELLNNISPPDIFNQHHFPSISCLYFEDNSLNSFAITIGYLLTTNYYCYRGLQSGHILARCQAGTNCRPSPIRPGCRHCSAELASPGTELCRQGAASPGQAHSSLMGQ